MSKRKKARPSDANSSPAASNGQAGEKVQRSLFDTLGDSQVLIILRELIAGLVARVEKLEQMLLACLNRLMGGAPFTEKDYYTPKEFAKIVDRKVETIRENLKVGRIEGLQTNSGRGGIPEWRISNDELKRYQREGLRDLPPEKQYRHFK